MHSHMKALAKHHFRRSYGSESQPPYRLGAIRPPPKCGRVDIRTYLKDKWEGGADYELTALMEGQFVGNMDLETVELEELGDAPVMAVTYAKVLSPRCGIGTKLYERALKLACKHDIPLASDFARTEASEGFWSKQVAKGRAVCSRTDISGEKLKHVPRGFDTIGSWTCRRYVMREACPRSMDLSGRRRRRR